MFMNLAQQSEIFDVARLMQQQMNEPVIRENGLPDPGNNWKPGMGTNVNNAENLENDIFSAGDVPNRNKAVFIKNNVLNRKIKKVYDLNGLKQWLMRQRVSPTTRTRIESWNSIKLVPNAIYKKGADDVTKGIIQGRELQNIKKTNYVKRVIRLLQESGTQQNYTLTTREAVHTKTEQNFQNLRKSCAVYLNMLYDHVMSKRTNEERVKTLNMLDTFKPVCVENLCSSISEFILHDDNKFVFEFDSNADKVTNISNCANALRKSYCAMLKDGEINEKVFVKKMTLIYQRIAAMIKGKKASDGSITKYDIISFLDDYGDMLLECPGMSLRNGMFDGFKFDTRVIGD